MKTELSQEEVSTYQRDGVVFLPGAVASEWIQRLLAVVERQLANPSNWANDTDQGGASSEDSGRLFTDRYQWQTNPEINAFIRQSTLAKLAAQAMQSHTARFYFDHLLVKEPQTQSATPWHQDVPYWPFKGKQICSIWVALTETRVSESALEFVAGSHADGTYYMPEAFVKAEGNANAEWQEQGEGVPVPDIEADRSRFEIVGWDVKPGDALLFSAWLLHGASGNASSSQRRAALSTRWLGDDAIWFPHPGADPTVQQQDVSVQPGQPAVDDQVFPLLWPRVDSAD